MTKFHKMHGLGNDFIIIDERHLAADVPVKTELVAALSNRKTGIGCDQFLVLRSSEKADVYMLIFNADGSRAGACGNATRCVAKLVSEGKRHINIQTEAGLLQCEIGDTAVTVNMGAPKCNSAEIPLSEAIDSLHVPHGVTGLPEGVCVNMGNPHLVLFVENIEQTDCLAHGALLEQHKLFPEKANINFAHVLDAENIRLQTFERGVGLTQACGTGACATAVAARRRGLTQPQMNIHMPGGMLHIEWKGDEQNKSHHVLMTGDANYVFSGTLPEGVWS